MQWFDRKFDNEVNAYLLHEKLEKRLLKLGAPDLYHMRQGRDALRVHLIYLEKLAARAGLAGGQAPQPRRFRRRRPHIGARLFRRHALARVSGGEDLVHEGQIAPGLPRRSSPTAGPAWRRPRHYDDLDF